jgi:hypothetical protein
MERDMPDFKGVLGRDHRGFDLSAKIINHLAITRGDGLRLRR